MTSEEAEQIAELQAKLKELGRGCGTCQACCTVMAVDMAPLPVPNKPERKRCGHLCAAGCKIYDVKPDSCTSFMCIWLASELMPNRMDKNWRPDRVGAVVDVSEVGVITAHLRHEERWRAPGNLRDLLLHLARAQTPFTQNGFVILDRPSGNHLLFRASGMTQELIPFGVSASGNKQYRTKEPGKHDV